MRVVTPGTLTDTELLSDKTESILLAVHQGARNTCGLAWLSVTQGEIHLAHCVNDELEAWLARVAPSELLYNVDVTPAFELRLKAQRCAASARPAWQFDSALGARRLLEQLKVASLASWNAEALTEAHAAASALLGYAEHTQGRALSHVQGLQVVRSGELIELPQTTRRNLELTQTLRGEDSPTLFSLLDTCTTGMGSRALKSWLLTPRRDRAQAAARLEAVTYLRGGSQQTLRARLKGCSEPPRKCVMASRRAAAWARSRRGVSSQLLSARLPIPVVQVSSNENSVGESSPRSVCVSSRLRRVVCGSSISSPDRTTCKPCTCESARPCVTSM